MDEVERPHRLTRAESREQTHGALLVGAREVFRRLGYQRATLDLIAEEAGYTKGAIYSHFESKEALFLELLKRLTDYNVGLLDKALRRAEERPENLVGELIKLVQDLDARDDAALLMLELEVESRRNETLAEAFREVMSHHEADMTEMMRRLLAAHGREPAIPYDQLAASVIILSEGFALARQTRKGSALHAGLAIRALFDAPLVPPAD